MPLVVTAVLQLGTFDAATSDPSRNVAEWPPHPQRLFSALVDSASRRVGAPAGADEALRWLERQPPPEVRAAARVGRSVRSVYVPVNDLPSKPKHTLYPGRVSASMPKVWPRVFPESKKVRFVWADSPDAATAEALERLARDVPYLGRASSPVTLSVDVHDALPAEAKEEIWRPDSGGPMTMRVPFPGVLDALRDSYDRGDLPHEVRVDEAYSPVRAEAVRAAPAPSTGAYTGLTTDGPYADLVTFAMQPRPGLDGSATLAVTSQLRRAVISRIGKDVPALVHGHDGGHHVAWLALPFAASEHSTGRLMGVGVAIPAEADAASRSLLLGALLGSAGRSGLDILALPPPLTQHGAVSLERVARGGPLAVSWRHWTRPSRRWASVTPVVWDRFAKTEEQLGVELAASFRRAGYPEPVADGLSWSRTAFVKGAAQPRPNQVHRPGGPPLPYRHVLVEFAGAVRGPVVVGRLRHFGLGLFTPLDDGHHD
ncbi:MAG: type I-G CRISPR-associated protein Csb2 [Acidimicrobiales bacterium]